MCTCKKYDNVWDISCFDVIIYDGICQFKLINPQKDEITNVDDIFLRIFPQKNIFAAARMRFIFVTRCAGNKALFFIGLSWRNMSAFD